MFFRALSRAKSLKLKRWIDQPSAARRSRSMSAAPMPFSGTVSQVARAEKRENLVRVFFGRSADFHQFELFRRLMQTDKRLQTQIRNPQSQIRNQINSRARRVMPVFQSRTAHGFVFFYFVNGGFGHDLLQLFERNRAET